MSQILLSILCVVFLSACAPTAGLTLLPTPEPQMETAMPATELSPRANAANSLPTPDTIRLYRFDTSENAGRWAVVNDSVMGGVSQSGLALTEDDALLFTGTLSLDNNGGFASVRTAPDTFGLTNEAGMRLTVRGDGQQYHLRLYTPAAPGVAYEAAFQTTAGKWLVIDLPFTIFQPTVRGRILADYGPIQPDSMAGLGFIIKDNQVGEFRLEIASIEAYR